MLLTTLGFAVFSLLVLTGGNYFLYKHPHLSIELQLIGKNESSPEEDAAKDISKGKLYCFSINGFGPYFPGVETKNQAAICKKATEINFWGTSDAIEDEDHSEAIIKADNYSRRYNLYVVNNVRI